MSSSTASTSAPVRELDAKVTVRSRLDCIDNVRGSLNDNRKSLFRNTVFGPWLDFPPQYADVHLLNYFYQRQVNVDEQDDCPYLRFRIGDRVLEFAREEFCLITGFTFGPIAKEDTDVGLNVRGLKSSPFLERLFPQVVPRKTKKIKGDDLLARMQNRTEWDALSDEDAVRICLLLMATILFIGRESRFYIPDHLIRMIEDFDVWNSYPWGEYMWVHLYKRTRNVVKRHNDYQATKAEKKSPSKDQTYNLYGFVWAVKFWILETFPTSVQFWSVDSSKIPRGLAWSKFKELQKKHYPLLFDPGFKPLDKLVLRNDEGLCPWYTRSMEYIRGLQLQIVVSQYVDVADVDVPGDGDAEAVPGDGDSNGDGDGDGDGNGNGDGDGDGDGDGNGNGDVDGVDDGVTGDVGQGVIGDGGGVSFENDKELENPILDTDTPNETVKKPSVSAKIDRHQIQEDVISIKSSVLGIEQRVGDVDVKQLLLELEVVKEKIKVIENVLEIDNQSERKPCEEKMCVGNPTDATMSEDKPADHTIIESVKTPITETVVDSETHTLYYMDTEGYTGPMTQVVKGMSPVQYDTDHNFMEVDGQSNIDCGSLPNLNDAFAEFCDVDINLTPQEDFVHTAVGEGKKTDEPAVELPEALPASQGVSAECEKTDEPFAVVDEVICIDVPVGTEDVQVPSTFPPDVSVVLVENARSIFNGLKRKRKPAKYKNSPYTNLPDSTARVLRRRSSRTKHQNISPPKAPNFDDTLELPPLEPFVEDLERDPKGKKTKVNAPDAIKKFVDLKMDIKFMFPWGNQDTFADVQFWRCLLALDELEAGWLRDEHIDLWVDLMWTFRPPDSDWAMAGAFFCPAVMANSLRPYWANGVKYPVPWTDVERVFFPINEPSEHWATGELHIRTGVVTFYDTLPTFSKKRDWWNYTMPDAFSQNLSRYLKDEGVLHAKGIDPDGYQVTVRRSTDAPKQGCSYGDCGVWVCILLYRLGHNMSIKVERPANAGIAYRERMADYFWKYKIVCSE